MENYHSRQDLALKQGTGDLIRQTRVAIFGVGSIGNAVLGNLIRMGFRRFFIVDFDHIEASNLSKSQLFEKKDIGKPKAQVAAERARQNILHDHPEVEYVNGNLMEDVGKGIFWDFDIAICAVDTRDCRAYINDWCVRAGKPFFEVGMTDFQVNVSFFAPQGNTYPVCLRDQLGEGNFEGKRNSCSGLKVKDTELQVIPTIECTSAIAGALVAKELVLYLEGRSTIVGRTLFFFGLNNETFNMVITPNSDLSIRHEAFMPVTTVNTSVNPTVGQMLKAVETALGQPAVVKLPDTFVFRGYCNGCGKPLVYNRRKSKIWDHERWCENCRKQEDYAHQLSHDTEWVTLQEVSAYSSPDILHTQLRDIGIPKDDVLEATIIVNDEFETRHVRLSENKPNFKISEPMPTKAFNLNDDPADYYQGRKDASDDIIALSKIKELFNCPNIHPQVVNEDVTWYLSKQALDDFVNYAMQIYQQRGHEATGVIVGHYCTTSDHPNHKIAVGTHFIPAQGGTTKVTCEISLSDGIYNANYCDKHQMLPVCWIHSHPGFGAYFSGTDKRTLETQYNATYQIGVVIDILNNKSKAYRCVNGGIKENHYFVYDTEAEKPVIMTQQMKPIIIIKEKNHAYPINWNWPTLLQSL